MRAVVLFDPVSSGEMLKKTAHEMGFKVIAVFTQSMESFEEIYHVSQEHLFQGCDAIIVSNDITSILEELKKRAFKIVGAIAASEGGVEAADEIANVLGLWKNRFDLSVARRDKGEMRKVLKSSDLSCPNFTICHSEQEATDFAQKHLFPLIIKTPKGSATSQVYECDDQKALINNFHKIYGKPDIYGTIASCCVLEEYIGGKEYIIDTFSDGHKVFVTDVWVYEKIHSDTFRNIYYNVLLVPLEDPSVKPLIDYAIRVAEIFGVERGPAHIEIKDDPVRGPTLIEIGTRFGGMRIPQFVKKYTNFDPYKASIEVLVEGQTKIPLPLIYKKKLAIAFFPQMKGGKIEQIQGIEQIKKLSSYDTHILNVKIEDIIPPSSHVGTIPLVGFFAHSDREQLLRDLHSAHELFKISYLR